MKTKFLNDQELIDLYLEGDQSGLEELVRRYQKRLYAFIYTKIRDLHLADDMFQEAIIKIINLIRGGKYQERGKFISWAMRITHNMIMDYYRTAKRIQLQDNNPSEDFDIFDILKCQDENVVEKIITEQIHSDVRKLVDALPEDLKEVVVMRHYKRMSFTDIADELNINKNTALGRMRYALINIRKMIADKNIVLTVQ
jgi:RNA polymerase sigma factor (sigma-70 family)